MQGSIKCPYCGVMIPDSRATRSVQTPSMFASTLSIPMLGASTTTPESTLQIVFYSCPTCENYVVFVKGLGSKVQELKATQILPQSPAIHFPEYIPEGIRRDYEEACSILSLSPKAAATLARRCLQGMISDFWGIKDNRLVDAIDSLEGKIPAGQWKAINGLRRLGNIGAHMEKDINLIVDIDEGEAEKLVQLIEILLKQWYVDRFEQEQLYESISKIDTDKQNERKQ